jgi:UDP-N-acetylmuramate--alanine ligase
VGNVLWYSLKDRESQQFKKILKIPGEHNVSNALAVLTVVRALKIPDRIAFKTLSEYKGAWRRFEIKELKIENCPPDFACERTRWRAGKLKIISDYAHHPTEIKVTLKAAREKFPEKKIWCVFQPHQYQRTFYLFKDFVKVLKQAPLDKLIITDVYDVVGREEKEIKKKVNSKKLVEAIKKGGPLYKPMRIQGRDKQLKEKVLYISSIEEIANYLKKNLKGGEVVVIMGAGDIYKLVENLTESIKRKKIK